MCDYEYKNPMREEKKCPYEDESTEIQWKNKSFCIFHAPIESKDIKKFLEEFNKLINEFKMKISKEWDFEGFVFPFIVKIFRDYKFPEDVNINFRYSIFNGDLDFSGATFSGKASFSGATFSGGAYFNEVIFSGKADFRKVTFSGNTGFSMTKFSDEVGFTEATFSGKAYFTWVTFSGEANFILATFSGNADFTCATFSAEVYFNRAKFSGNADFSDTDFLGFADFSLSEFLCDVNFKGTTFSIGADFSGAKFSGNADFSWVKFSGEAYFSGITFSCETDLSGAEFSNIVLFTGSIFNRKLNLILSIFNSQVDFQNAYITEVDFSGTKFDIQPYFANMGAGAKKVILKNFVGDGFIEFTSGYWVGKKKTIEKPFTLEIYNFYQKGVLTIKAPIEELKIENSNFECPVEITNDNKNKYFNLMMNDVNFYGNVAIKKAKVNAIKNCYIGRDFLLDNCDLTKAEFIGTDLRRIDFINVKWAEIDRSKIPFTRSLSKINALYDEEKNKKILDEKIKNKSDSSKEEKLRQKEEITTNLSDMYRAVATSYESRQRYGSAGPFKVGEFEMRRNYNFIWRKGWFHIPKLERIFLTLYRWASFYGEEPLKPLFLILIILFITPYVYYIFQSICYLQGLIISLHSSTFYFMSENISKLKGWVQIIPPIQRLLSIIFTALFLFALRRKVKR